MRNAHALFIWILLQGRNRDKFDTKVVIQNMENGPTPDTAAFIQKMEEVQYIILYLK